MLSISILHGYVYVCSCRQRQGLGVSSFLLEPARMLLVPATTTILAMPATMPWVFVILVEPYEG